MTNQAPPLCFYSLQAITATKARTTGRSAGWDLAIENAEAEIHKLKDEIRRWRDALQYSRQAMASGEPYPTWPTPVPTAHKRTTHQDPRHQPPLKTKKVIADEATH